MTCRIFLLIFLGTSLVSPAWGQSAAEKTSGAAAASAGTGSAVETLGEAEQLWRKGDYEAARGIYERALGEDAKSIAAYAGLTRVYLKEEKIGQAEETISKAAEFAADKSLIQTAQGEVYFREGKIAEAEREFVKAVNADPSLARPRLGLARIYQAVSLYRRAKTMIDSAYRLDAEDPDIYSFWMDTLSRRERIRTLEARLADEKRESDESRKDLRGYLDYLKAQEAGPPHACRLANKLTAAETPLEPLLSDPTHLRGYGLAVTVNGQKARPMLDTGASGLLVSRKIGEKAGIVKVMDSKVGGFGDKGASDSYIGYAESIKIGKLEFRDCRVEVLEKRSVDGDDGLIGGDVFEDFLVDIDFPNRKLKLTELPRRPNEAARQVGLQAGGDAGGYSQGAAGPENKAPSNDASAKAAAVEDGPQDRYIAPEMQSYMRVFRFGHELLVPTKVNETPEKLFLLDTGSLANQISPQAARETTKVHDDPDTRVEGLSGYVKRVYSADKAVLQFGHLRQENQDISSIDLSGVSQATETEVSGILGFVMLHFLDIKIDYRDGLVDFQYIKDPRY